MPRIAVFCSYWRRDFQVYFADIFCVILTLSIRTYYYWYRCCTTNRKVAGSIPPGVNGFLISIKSFRSHYGPGVDSASNRNEYREYFLGVKCGRCVRLTTYQHPVPLSRNLGALTSWNALGLSRPVMGTALLFFKLLVQLLFPHSTYAAFILPGINILNNFTLRS